MNLAFTPYRPQSPASPSSFVGRDAILDATTKIMELSRADQISDVEILGRRGLGKTSTLLKIRSMAPSGHLTMYFPGRKRDETEFVDELLQAIEREYRDLGKGSITFVDLAAALRRGEKTGTSVLIEAVSRLDDIGLFVLLDDADVISSQTLATLKSAFNQLRSVHAVPVGLIFASEVPLSERISKGGLSPTESFVFSFKLEPFTLEETTALLARSYDKWTKNGVQHVSSTTKGHPVLVQMYSAAYPELAKSDGRLDLLGKDLPKPEPPGTGSGWREWAECFFYQVLEIPKRVAFEAAASELVTKCDEVVKDAFLKWYMGGWTQKPSNAEWKSALTIVRLGGSARFKDIKRAYGGNPAPQLKRAVEKRIIERRGRGVYAVPHPLITKALQEKYFTKRS